MTKSTLAEHRQRMVRGDVETALPSGADHPVYNTQAVVQLTGVPAPTFRAWERRYGVPHPERLAGGQRLYSEYDVALIRWLHARTVEGMTISRAMRLLEARRVATPTPAQAASGPRSFALLQVDLVERLLAFDPSGAEAIMAEAFALYPVEEVCLALLQPTLVELGERWHQGTISIATEHFATNLIRRKLFALLQVYDNRGHGAPVVLACPLEELHEVGLMLVALFLTRRGWPIIYLGPNVPTSDLRDAVDRLQPRMVILSATTEETVRHLAEALESLATLPEPRPILAYGGNVFEQDSGLQTDLPGLYLGHDARSAAAHADALLGAAPTP